VCGITGAIWTDPQKAIDAAQLARMTDALAHRGPDDAGYFTSDFRLRPPYEAMPGVALGHRRLSIIDIAGGHQPMANEDGSIQVVFNGEIFNFPALRQRLEGSGHKFRTQCDTEVIAHLYEDEGPDCFTHLVGMFAIAIWDANRRRLVLARDRLGQKPLVYRHNAGRLLFASELKSLLTLKELPREIDRGSLDEYLTYQYVPHPNTILRGFRKLPPAHVAIYLDDKLEVRPYWSPDFSREVPMPRGEDVAQVREKLEEAVRIRLRSDVPLGAFLSGGVDSSLIVALMQKHSAEPVKTFSIGFSEREYDESPHARGVAAFLKTEHHEFKVTPDAIAILPKLIWHYDEPFADSSAIPTWYLSKLTREHVTVALTGDGGDELFGGYRRYQAMRLGAMLDRLPDPLRAVFAMRAWQWLPASGRRQSQLWLFKRFNAALRLPPARRYLEIVSIFNEARRAELYSEDALAALPESDPFGFLSRAWQRSGKRDAAAAAMNADLITYLPCDINNKVDIASMAHGLECRQPFLDHRLVELAVRLPSSRKLSLRRSKRILRDAFSDAIPPWVWRRKKQGFGVPLDHWFRHELKDLTREMLLSQRAKDRNLFNPAAVERLFDEHQTRRFPHHPRLWSLLVLELWQREWIDH
jgi:asparagine synthase (glutamine-hydrolysing)